MRPRVFPDGDQWCALYGEYLMTGVCGFGDTPSDACAAFDIAWTTERCGLKPTISQPQNLARQAGLTADEVTDPSPKVPKILRDTPRELRILRTDGHEVRIVRIKNMAKYGIAIEFAGGECIGHLANLETGMEIPYDELVMLFRAGDIHAQREFMQRCNFLSDHPERMQEPT